MRVLISVLVSLMASVAMAGEFFVLDMEDAVLKSSQGDDTIRIKRELRDQHGLQGLRKAQLLSVVMVAKTAAGKGSAQLMVGGDMTAKQVVGGNGKLWQQSGEKSFDRVLFENPKGKSQGPWQMQLNGNFKIRQMVVEISMKQTREIVLNYNHVHMEARPGSNDTVHLRAKAKQQHGIDTADYDLISATMKAKSRRGKGQAHLLVGQTESDAQRIAGMPDLFAPQGNYHPMTFENPKGNSDGVWQIKLRGNIKLRQVILKVREK